MIAFVHGMAVDMTESSVVVEAGGIGYEIYMTGADLSEIRMGEDVKVHTYFSVREDAMKLYGFRAKDDLQMFKLLLGVNGVGPKAALGVLEENQREEKEAGRYIDQLNKKIFDGQPCGNNCIYNPGQFI